MSNNSYLAYKAHREELRKVFQESILRNLTKLGEKAKELDFLQGIKKKNEPKKPPNSKAD